MSIERTVVTSYAQNFEDVILWRALKHVDRGFYIDIGAQHPVFDSVSLAFYERGWQGVHVEPVANYARELRRARPDEQVLEVAIGTREPIPKNDIADIGHGAIAQRHNAGDLVTCPIEVPCITLSRLLDAQDGRTVHWLKIDVEGKEQDVIESWSPSPVRPWVVLVESTISQYGSWEPSLLALGYEFVYFDGLNRFYLHCDQSSLREHFGVGPNVFDGFVISHHSAFCPNTNLECEYFRRAAASWEVERKAFQQAAAGWDRANALLIEEIAARNSELESGNSEIDSENSEISRLRDQLAQRDDRIHDLLRSRSWRLTRPLRAVTLSLRWLATGTWAWISLRPGSRPRRVMERMLKGRAGAVQLPALSVVPQTSPSPLEISAPEPTVTPEWQVLEPHPDLLMEWAGLLANESNNARG